MRLLTLFLLLSSLSAWSQVVVFNNGMVYKSEDISRMRQQADSLTKVFNTQPVLPVYSLSQGYGNGVKITKNKKAAIKAMHKGMPYEKLVSTFSIRPENRDTGMLVQKQTFIIAYGQNNQYYLYLDADSIASKAKLKLKRKWLYIDEEEALLGIYFTTDLEPQQLPEKYARWIRYYAFMVDTTTKEPCKFIPDTPGDTNKIKLLWDYLFNYPGMPQQVTDKGIEPWDEHHKKFLAWNEKRLAWVDSALVPTPKFKAMLTDAANYAITHCISNADLEDYVEKYLDPAIALKIALMQPMVNNSYPQVIQSQNVRLATMAARAGNFKLFLQKHLKAVEYQCFPTYPACRAIDKRVKELDAVGVNTIQLILGALLYSQQTPGAKLYFQDHYMMAALAQYHQPDTVANTLLEMIRDDKLDDGNRSMAVGLLIWFLYCYDDAMAKPMIVDSLKEAAKTLPPRLQPDVQKAIDEDQMIQNNR